MAICRRLLEKQTASGRHPIADVFDRDKSVISKHISNVYEEGELVPERIYWNVFVGNDLCSLLRLEAPSRKLLSSFL